MSAAANHDQSVWRVDDDRGVFRDVVLDWPGRRLKQTTAAEAAEIPLRMDARHRSEQPHSRSQGERCGVLDELPAQSLVLRFDRRQAIRFNAVRGAPAEKDPLRDVHTRQRARVLLHELAPERNQPAGVIAVIVREHHVGDVRQIDLHLGDVLEHRFGARAGIDQDAAAVGFEHGREAPLANAAGARAADQHRRQDGDLHRLDLRIRSGSAPRPAPAAWPPGQPPTLAAIAS